MDTQKIIDYGNLPASLEVRLISPHLAAAERDAKRLLATGLYDSIIAKADTDPDKLMLEEAIICLTLAGMIPAIHTVYTRGMMELKESAYDGFYFLNPTEQAAEIKRYTDRAQQLIEVLNPGTQYNPNFNYAEL